MYDGRERREWGVGRPQQVVCCKARDETGGLDLEGRRGKDLLLASLFPGSEL